MYRLPDKRIQNSNPFIVSSLCLVMVLLAATPALQGAGSSEQSPEETAQDTQQKAVEEYNRGVKHMERGNELARVGDSAFAYNYRATSDAKSRKEYEKAAARLSRATELNTEFADAFNNLGYVLRKLGRLSESLDAYNSALRIDSTHARALEYRGETYLALGKVAEARKDHERLRALKSPLADTLKLAIDLYDLDQLQKKLSK